MLEVHNTLLRQYLISTFAKKTLYLQNGEVQFIFNCKVVEIEEV